MRIEPARGGTSFGLGCGETILLGGWAVRRLTIPRIVVSARLEVSCDERHCTNPVAMHAHRIVNLRSVETKISTRKPNL